jgi:hypothetical protein
MQIVQYNRSGGFESIGCKSCPLLKLQNGVTNDGLLALAAAALAELAAEELVHALEEEAGVLAVFGVAQRVDVLLGVPNPSPSGPS